MPVKDDPSQAPQTPEGLRIRAMQPDDVGLGLDLCRQAGWNQVEADWRRLLALAPGGLFVAEQDGVPCGTASTTCYGKQTAWIGMILVHTDFRRRGIGTALMDRCIEHLRGEAIESIKLDATHLGRPLYLQLGFQDERAIHRYAGPRPPGLSVGPAVSAVRADDWPAIAKCDLVAFGADRTELLRLFANDGPSAVVRSGDDLLAYGFAREGFHASFIGPLVAVDTQAARAVAEGLLAQLPDEDVYWDLMPDNEAADQLAASLGFSVARRLTRMYLGDKMNPGDVGLIYGAGGFEVG
jgi:GNAT superfamily N-acetyltransferase